MNIGSIFLVLAVLIPVALFVAQPYLERTSGRLSAEAHDLSALLAERDRVVNALQELDFDYNLNKIPAEDYPLQRTALLQKGAEVLKKLDAMSASSRPAADDDQIEQALAARRKAKPSSDDDDVEARIAARRTGRKDKSGGFCPRCGKPVMDADRFCPSCGKSLS